ncbi:FtsX-like permease family protein [Phenylobacterium sp. J367]|uniref:FtsX-like permease family protein n=1 Tax=Phenylobacterium sp. J367 TaxID=2898435 RepID=UPI002151E791|nr:FtsX-like permease family protein [Phenylobacterium sp. J367]MCR5881062.1 hypothetical protein [Phenylobacterium sp. J367]
MRLSPLDRKLLRDLWRLRWQTLAIALLVACGVAVAVMSFSAQRALVVAQAGFYAESRFADVFATARRIPASRVRDLARLDGVVAVDARIVEAGLMDVPGLARPATVRLVSLPVDEARALNRITLTAGRMPDPARADEAVALKTFMDAAGVSLGDRLDAVVNGRAFTFTVVGAALSPEYVYVPAQESFMPDDAHQAVIWAPAPCGGTGDGNGGHGQRHRRARGGGRLGSVSGAGARPAPRPLWRTRRLRPRGPGLPRLPGGRTQGTVHLRDDPASCLPAGGRGAGAPDRLAAGGGRARADRPLEGVRLPQRRGRLPYLRLAAIIGATGALAGGLAGVLLASAIVEQYREYFRFPVLEPRFHLAAFAGATAVAVTATLAGSLSAVRRAAALSPAVAMQPLRPAAYRKGLLDRWVRGPAVDQATRMIVRNLERFPGRAALATAGLAASLSLLVGTQFLFDSLDAVLDHTYFRSQRWNEAVGFAEARSIAALAEVGRLPGVYAAEPVRIVAARLEAGGRQELSRLVGVEPAAALQTPLDARGRPVPFRGDGLVLSEALAGRLGVREGALVRVEPVEGRPVAADMRILAVTRDYSGFAAYLPRRALNRLLEEGDVISGAQLLIAADARPEFYRAIESTPQVTGASSRDDTVASWRLAMAEAFRVMISFYVSFAAAIGFGVAYNTSRIALSERSRDLATLQVLGFGRADCAYILVGELAVLTLVAIPLGMLGGQALAHGLVAAYSRDELRLPAVIGAPQLRDLPAGLPGGGDPGGRPRGPAHLGLRSGGCPEDEGIDVGKVRWARWGLGLAIAALVATVLALLFAPRPVEVDAASVRRGPIAETVADQGYARVREAYVVAAPVSGRLQRLDMHVGDRVTAGQTVVARLFPASADLMDPRARAQAEAQVAAAAAAVGAATAQQEQLAAEARRADSELRRAQTLSEQGFAAARAVENAEADARAARAAVRSAAAQLGMRRSELAAARAALLGPDAPGGGAIPVTSPASGYVTRVLQESERTVVMGAPLVEIGDQAGLEAAVEFLTQDAVRIREGMPAEIYDWGGDGVIPAIVRRVEPQGFTKVSALGVEEQRVLVLLQFDGPSDRWARLGPGYRLWGRVILRRAPAATTAPVGALVRADGRWAVFRIEGGRARLTPIEVGAVTDKDAEVRQGLQPGERVVVFPSDKVRDGARVRVRVAAAP